MDCPDLLRYLYHPLVDGIMRQLIDDDYVLISPSARNRRLLKGQSFGRKTSGFGWHVDARFLGNQAIMPNPNYTAITVLESFGRENGATEYVPNSHKLATKPTNRNEIIDAEILCADQGAIIVFDTLLWHKISDASEKSRWALFNMYGPWYMKPYHRFHDMFDAKEMEKFDPIIRQLLHWDSNPPRDHTERMATLRRIVV